MPLRLDTVGVIFLAMLAAPPPSWAQVAATRCPAPALPLVRPPIVWPECRADAAKGVRDNPGDLSIDATRGYVTGRLCYGRKEVARVEIFNKNPFYFSYILKVDEKVVAETAVGDFLAALVSAGVLKLPDTKPNSASAGEAAPTLTGETPGGERRLNVPPPPRPCTKLADLEAPLEAINDKTGLKGRLPELKERLEQEQLQQRETNLRFEQIKPILESPLSECIKLQDAAKVFVDFKPASIDLQCEARELVDINQELEKLKTDIARAKKDEPACMATMDKLENAILKIQLTLPEFGKALDALIKGNESLDALRATIAKVAADPHSFYEIVSVGPMAQDTDATLTLERQGPTAKDKLVTVNDAKNATRLEFRSDPRFVLGAGVAATRLRTRSFSIVKGFALNPDGSRANPGSTAPDNVVAVDESSTSRVTPMLVLHGRLIDLDLWGLKRRGCLRNIAVGNALQCQRAAHGIWASAGLTANGTSKGTDIEFLVGLSTDLIENNLFLTIGRYWGKVEDIQDSLYPGAKVPDGVTSLPLRKMRRWTWGIALSYKIK